MKEDIIVIGTGASTGMIGKAIAHVGRNVIIVDDETVKKEELFYSKSEPFVLHNPYPASTGISFICKGKHQYRLSDIIKDEREYGTITREVWSCQCGKVLGT